jgi:formamidopyrimidine-DNA glycosylase
MPELPEVETIVRELAPVVRGARLGPIRMLRPDIVRGSSDFGNGRGSLKSALDGQIIRQLGRHGKRLLIEFESGSHLVIHLGMTGQLHFVPSRTVCRLHTHLRIGVGGSEQELRFVDARRFGGIWFLKDESETDHDLSPLGPDALTVSKRTFVGLMRRRRQIKALLLDQQAISGLGNIYVDESLHAARLHPLTCACALPETTSQFLWRAMRRILRQAIRAKGSTISDYRTSNDQPGEFQNRHRVYGRQGKPCFRCRTPIVRLKAAGRSSHLCPTCQPFHGKLIR